jgi:hypothetical protein
VNSDFLKALLALVDRVPLPQRWHRVLATLSAVLVAAAGVVTVTVDVVDTGTPGHPHATVTVKVNQAPDDGHPTATITAPAQTVDNLADQATDLHNETPRGMTSTQLNQVRAAADKIRKTQPPLPTAGASAGFAGCRTEFVRNQSSRGGVRPQWQVLHYTVSHNVPGWADVNAVVALFDRSSAQASSNFVIDAEGNCAYIVPIEAKAWTQAAGNPFSISYEVIDYGNESAYMGIAGYARLRSVMLQVKARTGIPMRLGSTNGNCAPGAPGIIQHADLGICGGGHHDINPFSKQAVFNTIAGPPVKPVSRHARGDCQDLNGLRKHKDFGTRATKLKKALTKHGYVCSYGPPGKIARR